MYYTALVNHTPYDEKNLLLQISEGNEHAFRQLFDDYRGKLFTYLFKITESKETAEDGVHDVFLKIWLQKDKLPAIQNLNAYLYRMAHNHAFNGIRKMATETLVLAVIHEPNSFSIDDPEISISRKEVRNIIHEAVKKLSPRQRDVFRMSRELGLKQEDIAQQLGISVLTVKAHLTDALHYLRTELSSIYGNQAIALYVIFSLTF